MSKHSNQWIKPLAAAWFIAAVAGSVWLTAYAQKPGQAGSARSDWPRQSALVRPSDKPTLVLTLHPKCPCSVATVREFGQIVSAAPRQASYYVLLVKPDGATGDWSNTRIADAARQIPGVRIVADDSGLEAAAFGAKTSGQVCVYDESGRLRYTGGITASRGHEGGNAGRAAVEQILLRQSNAQDVLHAPVYGCGLTNEPEEQP